MKSIISKQSESSVDNQSKDADIDISVLEAYEGDCIFITISNSQKAYTIMIDSGVKATYQFMDRKKRIIDGALKHKITELKRAAQIIDLIIITHVDEDHIGGIVEWVAKDDEALTMMDIIWVNNGELINIPDYSALLHSIPQGRNLETYLRNANKKVINKIVKGYIVNIPFGGRITVLTPTIIAHNVIAEQWNEQVQNKTPSDYQKPIKQLLDYQFNTEDRSKTNCSSISFLLEIENRKYLF